MKAIRCNVAEYLGRDGKVERAQVGRTLRAGTELVTEILYKDGLLRITYNYQDLGECHKIMGTPILIEPMEGETILWN